MKYTLGIWKDLQGYPTKEDVIFELISTIAKISDGKWEISEKQLDSFFSKYSEIDLIRNEIYDVLLEKKVKDKTIFSIKEDVLKEYI